MAGKPVAKNDDTVPAEIEEQEAISAYAGVYGPIAASLIGWIIQHFRIWTSPTPAGPVILVVDADEYVNISVNLFFPFTFSVRLRRRS
jgi:flavorubredoxin